MGRTWDSTIESLTPIEQCVAVSRLLGGDPSLVLHGGGNTSVKEQLLDATGEPLDVLHVKGSGWDLATIRPAGFVPLHRERLLELVALSELDDEAMVHELRLASLREDAPTASIEAILHAVIPSAFVLHSHADAIVTLGDQPRGREVVAEALGEDLLVIDYIKPGFGLARAVAAGLAASEGHLPGAVVLLKHGLFTFADDARGAYEAHLRIVDRAAAFIAGRSKAATPVEVPSRSLDPLRHASRRREISSVAGRPLIALHRPSSSVDRLRAAPSFPDLALRGPITPEHVIRTKRIPMIGDDVIAYAAEYREYVERNREGDVEALDPAPRVILDPLDGLIAIGETVSAAGIAADIYEHTAAVAVDAESMSRYSPISEAEAFEIEYWSLEQAKLRTGRVGPPLQGEIALVLGAGPGCARGLLAHGAAVAVAGTSEQDARWLDVGAAVADMSAEVEGTVRHFGGLDVLVAVDLDATRLAAALESARPYLALAPNGGRVVVLSTGAAAAPPDGVETSGQEGIALRIVRSPAGEPAAVPIILRLSEPGDVPPVGVEVVAVAEHEDPR